MEIITSIKFRPAEGSKGQVGFVSFKYGEMMVGDVAVYERLDGGGYRCVYPEKIRDSIKISIIHPFNKKTQEEIDRRVTEFVVNQQLRAKD